MEGITLSTYEGQSELAWLLWVGPWRLLRFWKWLRLPVPVREEVAPKQYRYYFVPRKATLFDKATLKVSK